MPPLSILIALFAVVTLTASAKQADLTQKQAETALNAGKIITGKSVAITVREVQHHQHYYTIEAGEHLNFMSTGNPKVKVGDRVVVTVRQT